MIKKKLVVANGKYITKDGSEKTRWVNVGALHEHEGKKYITLDRHINLSGLERKEGETRIFVNFFDPEPMKNNFQKSNDFAPSQPDEEIPF